MISQQELDLLIDLAKLVKKHGPTTFELLAESISSPQMVEHLSQLLTQIAKSTQSISGTKGDIEVKRRLGIPKILDALKFKDPKKYEYLINFYNKLNTKAVLPSLRDIKEFAAEGGLPYVRARSRQEAIIPIITSLVQLPNEQLIVIIESIKKQKMSDRSLEGWSKIILDNQHR